MSMRREQVGGGSIAVVAAIALVLTGCTTGDGTEAPTASASSTYSERNPAPNDGDESQDQWAHLKELVAAKYPDAEPAVVGSAAKASGFHISPADTSGTTGIVFAVSCKGGGAWRIDVEQENAQTITGRCDGPDPEVQDAVALDDHPTGVSFDVSPPKGTRFWMVTSYTHG